MTTADMKGAALAYAKRGWPVFPCKTDKSPYTEHGVLEATVDPEQIEEWWTRHPGANIGLHAGEAGFVILDYDPGSDKGEVANALGEEPPVTQLIARTPRGGTHEYYFRPDGADLVASTTAPFAEHVDVRSFHGYVLLPPSRTKDGAYVWESEEKPATASPALLDACRKPIEKDPARFEWLIEPDMPEHIGLAI